MDSFADLLRLVRDITAPASSAPLASHAGAFQDQSQLQKHLDLLRVQCDLVSRLVSKRLPQLEIKPSLPAVRELFGHDRSICPDVFPSVHAEIAHLTNLLAVLHAMSSSCPSHDHDLARVDPAKQARLNEELRMRCVFIQIYLQSFLGPDLVSNSTQAPSQVVESASTAAVSDSSRAEAAEPAKEAARQDRENDHAFFDDPMTRTDELAHHPDAAAVVSASSLSTTLSDSLNLDGGSGQAPGLHYLARLSPSSDLIHPPNHTPWKGFLKDGAGPSTGRDRDGVLALDSSDSTLNLSELPRRRDFVSSPDVVSEYEVDVIPATPPSASSSDVVAASQAGDAHTPLAKRRRLDRHDPGTTEPALRRLVAAPATTVHRRTTGMQRRDTDPGRPPRPAADGESHSPAHKTRHHSKALGPREDDLVLIDGPLVRHSQPRRKRILPSSLPGSSGGSTAKHPQKSTMILPSKTMLRAQISLRPAVSAMDAIPSTLDEETQRE